MIESLRLEADDLLTRSFVCGWEAHEEELLFTEFENMAQQLTAEWMGWA